MLYCSFRIFTLILKVAKRWPCFVHYLHGLRWADHGLGRQEVDCPAFSCNEHMTFPARALCSNELWITQWPCRPSVQMLSTMVSHEMYHFTSAGAQMCGDHCRWPYLFLSVGQWAEAYASEAFREMGAGSWHVNLIPSDFPLGRSLAWLGLVCQSPSKSQGNYYL